MQEVLFAYDQCLQRKGGEPVDWLHQSKCAYVQDGCNLLDGDKNKALTKRKLKGN